MIVPDFQFLAYLNFVSSDTRAFSPQRHVRMQFQSRLLIPLQLGRGRL
jgi:hypothetical protein